MITPMLRPDLFGGLATHAGDALFELCYLPEFREAARALRDAYDGSYERFWEDFRSGRPPFSKKEDEVLLNTYCMAACYSAREDGTVHLPFDLETARSCPTSGSAGSSRDPVRRSRATRSRPALAAGDLDRRGPRDEYYLDLGATAFRNALAAIGVPDAALRALRRQHGNISTATRRASPTWSSD